MSTRRLLLVAAVLGAVSATVTTQSSLTGRWRAVVLQPGGPQREVTLDPEVDGTAVGGTITGPPVTIRDGRLDGDTVTLHLVNPNNPGQQATLTGQVSGNEIVFRATGLTPQPIHTGVSSAASSRTASRATVR